VQLRNNAFERERRLTLTLEGVLRIAGPGGETWLPVHDIGLIELSAESSVASSVSYVCQIYRKRAWFPAVTIKSKRYCGPNHFVDERAAYRALLLGLHAQIVANAWPVKTQAAARPAALLFAVLSYAHWAFFIGIGAFVAALMGLAALDPPWVGRIPAIAFAVGGVAALSYLIVKAFRVRNDVGPWPYEAARIPEGLLPAPLDFD
jgi:hypothetical protein